MNNCVRSLICLLGFSIFAGLYAQANFSTSLHATRDGKTYWYAADTSLTGAPAPGFEILTGISIEDPRLACRKCHDATDANGNPYPANYEPGCVDCHATNSPGMPVDQAECYNCHGRQKKEHFALGYSDVHRDASNPLVCWDCHAKESLHGDDGVHYKNMMEPGAITADCEDCHSTSDGTMPADHANHDPHNDALHCSACHAQTVISCYSCHLESQLDGHQKRAKQAIHDFVILANREKDGKVGTMSFQSITYDGKAWAAFAPFHSHTITGAGRTCADCHQNMGGSVAAIQEYNNTGEMQFATWNDADSTLSWLHGIVPMPLDYERSWKMDYLKYNGDPADPVGPSKNWSSIGKDQPDGHQMFYSTPLSKVQMAKLGFDTLIVSGVNGEPLTDLPTDFRLIQNYPNPFNPITTIGFYLPRASNINLVVYNIVGQEVARLEHQQRMAAGLHEIQFNAEGLASGVYIYRLYGEGFNQAKKMILLR